MIHVGDCLEVMRGMAAGSVQTCVTSPPYYGLRDYGVAGQIGLEQTPGEFVARLVEVFREVRRVLRDDGTLWLNLGDSYANDGKWGGSSGGKHASGLHGATGIGRGKVSTGLKPKDLVGIPWRVAFALQEDGWFLRQDIIWAKPNPMPESVTDRCTKAHEYLFLLSKSQRYYFDAGAIREQAAHDPAAGRNRWDRSDYGVPGQTPQKRRSRAAVPPRHAACDSTQDGLDTAGRDGARNKRSVWTVATRPFRDAHFATFPEQLIEPCILAGAPAGGVVLDPFIGAGTTAVVAERLGRQWLGCELNPEYAAIARTRIQQQQPGLPLGLPHEHRHRAAARCAGHELKEDNMATEPLVFIKMPEVKRRTGLGKTTIYDRISAGTFPAPVPLGGNAVGWIEAEVDAWQAARVAERDGIEPAKAA